MERKKEEWAQKARAMEKKRIQWQWEGRNGTYEGELKDHKPHGLGKWKQGAHGDAVEGEWKDGLLHGKVVQDHGLYLNQYEAKDGKIDGKYLIYYSDGRRLLGECKGGKYHGRYRIFGREGAILSDAIFEDGELRRRIK